MSTKKKATAPKSAETQTVKFVKNGMPINLSYLKGDIATLEYHRAQLVLDLGFAELVDTENQEAEETENTENTAAQIAEDVQPENE